jgi:exopolysaccharide production protein ExoZ
VAQIAPRFQALAPWNDRSSTWSMYPGLHLLRALAVVLVVYHHTHWLLQQSGVSLPLLGISSMEMILTITGFVTVHATAAKNTSASEFTIKRFARIIPLYWFLTALVFVVTAFRPQWFWAPALDLELFVASLLFFPHSGIDGNTYPYLFVGWSLNLQAFFYVLLALALLARRWADPGLSVAFVVLALATVGLQRAPADTIAAFYTQPYMLSLGVGALLAVVLPHLPPFQGRLAITLLGTALVAGLLPAITPRSFWSGIPLLPAGAALGAVAALVLLDKAGVRPAWRRLPYLGEIAFAVFLVHPIVLAATEIIARKSWGLSTSTVWFTMAFAIVTTLASAALLHRHVDRPLVGRLLAWLGPFARPQGSTAPRVKVEPN